MGILVVVLVVVLSIVGSETGNRVDLVLVLVADCSFVRIHDVETVMEA